MERAFKCETEENMKKRKEADWAVGHRLWQTQKGLMPGRAANHLILEPCTFRSRSSFFNVVIGGIEEGGDVLCVHICHRHLQLLEGLWGLQVLRIVVNGDDPGM